MGSKGITEEVKKQAGEIVKRFNKNEITNPNIYYQIRYVDGTI